MYNSESSNEVVFLLCANCDEENYAGNCIREQLIGKVKFITINPNQGLPQTEAEVKNS